MESLINTILSQMQAILSGNQLRRLAIVLREALTPALQDDSQLLSLFLTAKQVEGCSSRTIAYYESTISSMLDTVAKPCTKIESDDLRQYLNEYETRRGAGKVTIDNIRRILSSFFSWLEDEDYIVKSPVRRIRRVKTATIAKAVLRRRRVGGASRLCPTMRDLALVDMLARRECAWESWFI